jgi:DNA-binding MarR family transcriptional regulator
MMNNSLFSPKNQDKNVANKVIVGLQRISESFKVLLWEKAKALNLSPIQIQILIFIENHKAAYCNVSYLAKEFNLTKPTISDAVKTLDKKGLIVKDFSSKDTRSYTIQLSNSGKATVKKTEDFLNPLKEDLIDIDTNHLESLFTTLSELIYQLNQKNILTVQRTCYACKFYSKNNDNHHCNLLQKELLNSDIRLDCNEFESVL